MKDGIQTYEFQFKFNAKDSKKQLKAISDDVLQMIHNMDTASNKMQVFTNFVGYLEKLDSALNQFKIEHKNDFANLFGDADSQLTQSLESAFGLSTQKLEMLGGLKSRIDNALASKASTEDLRTIAQDINTLFVAIGRSEELDINGLFTGKGNLNERINALSNALYKFYLQYQLLTSSVKNGLASGGAQGFAGLSEDVQQEVKRLSDAYDELITIQQKLQKAQTDIDKIHSKNNKKVVDQYKIELTKESVSQLMAEFDLLDEQIKSGDTSSKEYYDNLLNMTDVVLKLNSALKTIRNDKSLMTTFQGVSVGEGYSHMFDKLSKYTTVKATQFENNFLGKTLTDGLEKIMKDSRTRIENVFTSGMTGLGGGFGPGSGDGNGEKQVSLYKQLVASLKEYTKAYKEYKALEEGDGPEDELEEKGDYVDELREKIYQLVKLSDDASDQVSTIFNVYENGKYNFDQLVDELTKVLGITKEINEEGGGKKLKTYEELLKIVDQLNVLGLDIGELDDSNIQKLISDLKELYATEEQLDDVDDILSNLISGDIEDTTALKQLAKLFGIQIPESINTASQKYEDFINKINKKKSTGLKDEFDAGQYLSEMEQLKNELQVLRDQGRITEGQFDQLQKTFSKDVKGYVDEFIGRSNILKELNKLNQDATLTDDKESLEAIVQKRREILATAEQNGILLDKQLADERAITDEIEKRIGMQRQDSSGSGSGGDGTGTGTGTGTGSDTGSGEGSGSGSDDASEENEQYQRLLETIRNVEQAVKDKTAAFVTEKETVDDVAAQEIESLSQIAGCLETIRTAAQDVFGTKQGIVNASVKEWQQALESIYNTMQSISNMQSVEEMLSRMASNALDIKNNLNVSGDSANVGPGAHVTDTITNVDFTSLEGTIKSEISSLISKLDNVLKVEVVKSDAEEIKTVINNVKTSIDNIATSLNDYKSNASDQQKMQIDAMKNNLLQLQQFVSNFNERMVDSKYQQQEITGAILSDGSISLGYGEKGEVPWDRVASSLVANLTKSMIVDLHSHPLKQLTTGQMYTNDAFSGSSGDLSAFSFSKELGAKLAAEITGNVMRVLDISKLPATDMMRLRDRLRYIEQDYAKRPEYSNYITHEDGKIKYNQQSTLQGQHKVTQIFESMMYDAFKHIGYSKDKVDKEIFKKYDLTDDAQLTELASKLVQLSNASQAAIEPINRLKQIVSLFDGNLGSSEAKTAFDAFTKGELSAADVFNQLNGKGHKISQETMDSLFRIDSANEIPAIESLLTQVTSILNTISSSVSSIDGKIKTSTGDQFDYALNDMMEFSGLNDIGTEITKRITSTVKSKFDPSNVSEYKVQELSLNALNKAQELIDNFKYVESENGQISVELTQAMFDHFVSTLRAMEDAMNQEELYRERTGKKVLNDQGKNIEDDLVTTFYAAFNKTNIQAMRDMLARGKEKWQAKKDSYGDGPDTKVDSIAQNVDSLTAAISELQTIVSGLQQYIASPQFTIKADTSSLEESLSNVSAEINTGAQKIADAVNEFGSRVSTPVEQGQVSIDSREMTMAMKEALYAKEFASNYAKVEFHDVMDYDWNLDQYSDALTGELIGAFEEADRYFEQHFSNFYKSLDGSFIGTKELALEDLIQNQSKNDDFATVIVQAIQDQTGKIVNAIKIVLPDSISSNMSGNGALVNEEQIASAFKIVAQRASNWSNNNWSEPREFFNNVLSDSIYVDHELQDAFKTLGMLSSGGVPKFKVASEGLRNLGVAIGQDFALPSRPIELNQVDELMPLLNEAAKLGAEIPRIVSYFTDADRVFELQTKMKGDNIRSSFDWLNATVEQIDGFIHTLEVMNKVGLYPDFIGDNVLFDEKKGFSLVDIETQPLKWGLDSAEDMGNWFLQYINRLASKYEFSGQESEIERFVDLFEYRMSLPSDQRLVNENTIAAKHPNTVTPNGSADMSGFDASIDKITLAATALNDAAVRLGSVADLLSNGSSGAPNAEIDIYDPYDYQERKVMHFGELYNQEDDMSKKAIDDLALFTREYDQLWDTMTKEPIDIFDTAYPTDAEKAQILDIFEQIKQKNLEIANNSFVTEEELQRLRQLKAEVKGLQNELKGASLGFGFAEDYWENYRDIYGLGNFDAQMLADYIHGDDMHSSFTGQLSNMLQDKMVKVDRLVASDEIDDALIRGTKEFNQFLAEHAKKLLGEQSIFDPANVGYQQSDSSNINEESIALQGLASEVSTVEQAVRNKTAAFEAEGATVNQVVEGEIAALRELSDILNTIQTALQTIFSGNVYNFGNLDLLPDSINDRAETGVFQEIQQTLGQILTVLQGFTGLESDGENSLKHKEPVVDNGARTFDMSDALASKLNDLATEGTLVAIKDVVAQIADIIKANNDSEVDNDVNFNLNTLISTLTANVTSLKEVMDGVVVHQKAQKSDTKKAMARIQDPKQNQIISGLAKSAVDSLGDEAEVESLQALANGLVKVEGAFKNAEGQWQGFTVKINEHNEAVDLAVKKHSSFARLLNKGMSIEDDNPFVFSKDEVEARAKKHLDEYAAQGKNATVQFKDSGRYTITILEEIDGLSKQIFQTFDETDKKIERTTVTMSNSQKMKLDNLQKKLIENGLANDLINDKDSVYNDYQNASDALNNMTVTYSKLDDISEDQINQWKQQIALVQQLGSQVETLIKQRKLANDQKVFESDRSKKLSKFDLDKANLYSNIDMSKVSKDLVDDIAIKRSAIENATDADSLKIAINNWDELQNKIKAAAVQQDLYIKKTKEVKQEPDQFTKDLTKQKKDFAKYKTDAENALGVSQELKDELNELETRMSTIGSVSDLVDWIQDFKNLKTEISNAQKSFKVSQKAKASDIAGEANAKFAKDLNFKATDSNLTDEQKAIKNARAELLQQIAEYNIKVESGQEAEISGIEKTRDKLYELIDAYKKKYNIASSEGSTKKGQAFGLNQLQNFTARYNSLINEASNMGFDNQAPVVANLVNAYKQLQTAQSAFVAGEDKTTDVYAKKVEVFKAAQFECNNYARELNKVLTSSKKLEADSVLSDSLSEDFKDDIEGRKVALKDFVNSMYGSQATIGDFDKKFNELSFTVKNSDGTLTQMTATINQARTAIHATAGATKELSGGFSGFINSVFGKFKSIIPYLTASFGWQEIWQQVRQGVTYVKEIDSALTELKKVTSETDTTYDRFLQSMSKTAGVVGSTVSELTTMASEWARLGYSIEEAGKLAESTAILLNVSEFSDATSASEALISTMQAFQYTADDSQHVVDILNEVGKLLPVDNYIG